MSYKIKNITFLNDSRELIGINTAGITTALYVGETIEMDAVAGIITATEFVGGGSGITGIVQSGGDGNLTSLEVTNLATFNEITVSGVATFSSNIDLNGNDIDDGGSATFAGHVEANSLRINTGIATLTTLVFEGGEADENFTGITTDLAESAGATEAVTAQGVKSYVDGSVGAANQLNFTGDDGVNTGDIDLASEELDFAGTTNQIDTEVTVGAGQTVAFTLSSTLVLPGSLAFTGADADENFTGITTDLTESATATEAVTAAGVVNYVTNQVGANSVLTIEDDSANTGTISLGTENLVFNGTVNEVEVLVGGAPGELTIGLPDDVTIAGSLIVTTNFSFDGGQTVDEISTDGTLADDSDTAIPTEQAVKTYVDAQVSGGGGSSATILTADNQDNTAYSVSFVSATGAGSSVYTDATQLNYNPSTGLLVAQDFNSLSDIRYKENVETIDGAVAKLQQLRGVEFDWKNTPGSSVGVIAQEVQEVYPQLVTEGEEKITVNYNGLVGLLIQAVKEQADEIAALKEKLG